MTRLFVDCEFNGFGGELMSMAVVSDSGEEFYEVRCIPEVLDPWVAENVVPILVKKPVGDVLFRHLLHSFLRQFDNPTICADWYTDIVHFFHSMQGRDHTESFAYACKAELVLIDEYKSEIPHNALYDARAIREAWPT